MERETPDAIKEEGGDRPSDVAVCNSNYVWVRTQRPIDGVKGSDLHLQLCRGQCRKLSQGVFRGVCVMEIADLFKPVFDVSHLFISGEVIETALKILTAVIAVLLLLMKAYTFGRDKVLKKIRLFLLSDEGFWDQPTRRDMAAHAKSVRSGRPVLTVLNFKGGVGKTTVAANLAAYFDSIGARVLLLDFDYQGSLTDYVIYKHEGNLQLGAATILDPERSVDEVVASLERPVQEFKNTDVLAAAYSLNRTENRTLYRWLFRAHRSDIRFLLHDRLKSPQFRSRYDLVIIDAPPRITTASINAIAASSHILVPTILDGLSTSAASNTLELIFKLRDRIAPALQVMGVVPTMVQQSTGYLPRELRSLTDLRTELKIFEPKRHGPIELFENERILDRAAIAAVAHQEVAFFSVPVAETMFTNLGAAVAERIGGDIAKRAHDASQKPEDTNPEPAASVIRLGR